MRRYPPKPGLGAVVALVAIVVVIVAVLVTASDADNARKQSLPWRLEKIVHVRGEVHGCQRELGRVWSPVAEKYPHGERYRKWVLNRWRKRERFYCGAVRQMNAHPTRAIRHVFGAYASQALRVASCESGRGVYAQNGQYLGMFQMGSYARASYGHGWTALEQAWAAWNYFDDAGRDWSPWSCKPW